MKKSVKKTGGGGSIRPARSPVIAIRVPEPVHGGIVRAAKEAGMTMSEYVAQLITRGQEWQDAIGDARKLLHQTKIEAKRIVSSTLETELRHRNWKRNEKGWWAPPEVHGFPADGFIETEPGEPNRLDPQTVAEIERVVEAKLKEREQK
jgi:hypothetical protein